MRHRKVKAVIHKEENSDYGVSFPEFPGCITAGSTLKEAKRMAAEAIEIHIEGMIEDGEIESFIAEIDFEVAR